jgi:hypothetical protein
MATLRLGDTTFIPSIQAPAELVQRFPKGLKAVRPYLRLTPQRNKQSA